MKNITTQKIVEIVHQIENEPMQLSFIPISFPYYHQTKKENLFYKVNSRVDDGYTKGEISISLVELTPRSKRERSIFSRTINTRHWPGISKRIRKKLRRLKEEIEKISP